ncbi:MAG: SMC-Scp complex subunit ScpB, partial [Candidatus Eremiobacterota bacterium]
GKSDKAGKAFVYGTTKQFLRHFGIKSLDELPDIKNFK